MSESMIQVYIGLKDSWKRVLIYPHLFGDYLVRRISAPLMEYALIDQYVDPSGHLIWLPVSGQSSSEL